MEPRTEQGLLEYRCETARIERAAAMRRFDAAQAEYDNAIAAGELMKMHYQSVNVSSYSAINHLGAAGLANKGH